MDDPDVEGWVCWPLLVLGSGDPDPAGAAFRAHVRSIAETVDLFLEAAVEHLVLDIGVDPETVCSDGTGDGEVRIMVTIDGVDLEVFSAGWDGDIMGPRVRVYAKWLIDPDTLV